jgi:hypothetical protein
VTKGLTLLVSTELVEEWSGVFLLGVLLLGSSSKQQPTVERPTMTIIEINTKFFIIKIYA